MKNTNQRTVLDRGVLMLRHLHNPVDRTMAPYGRLIQELYPHQMPQDAGTSNDFREVW